MLCLNLWQCLSQGCRSAITSCPRSRGQPCYDRFRPSPLRQDHLSAEALVLATQDAEVDPAVSQHYAHSRLKRCTSLLNAESVNKNRVTVPGFPFLPCNDDLVNHLGFSLRLSPSNEIHAGRDAADIVRSFMDFQDPPATGIQQACGLWLAS